MEEDRDATVLCRVDVELMRLLPSLPPEVLDAYSNDVGLISLLLSSERRTSIRASSDNLCMSECLPPPLPPPPRVVEIAEGAVLAEDEDVGVAVVCSDRDADLTLLDAVDDECIRAMAAAVSPRARGEAASALKSVNELPGELSTPPVPLAVAAVGLSPRSRLLGLGSSMEMSWPMSRSRPRTDLAANRFLFLSPVDDFVVDIPTSIFSRDQRV